MSSTNFLRICLMCMLPFFGFSQNNYVSESKKSSWITSITLNQDNPELEEQARGYLYLLLDNQVNVQTEESFHRRAFKILNAQGIQEMSDFSIDFDPDYQQVMIHKINLIRDGKIIDKLNLYDLQIIQRETNLERHLYDGRLSALFNISDVRVNDIIDFSYTLEGFNPIHKGKFQNTYFLNFTDPVDRNHVSVLAPMDQVLNYKVFNKDLEPEIRKLGNYKKFSFDLKSPEIIQYQDNTPYWYIANTYVEFSQYDTWAQVAENFSGYYVPPASSEQWLIEKSGDIFKGKTDSITEIIRFVQDDIRYLGFENGLNSHKPSDPKEVFERRFGDCKDKALLLSELLKLQGVNANPILVSSSNGETVKDNLPSPNAFDHCIVQLNLEDETRYIDPTISFQGGNINTTFFPDYAYGLPLNSTEKDLIEFPKPETEPTQIFETIHVQEIGGKAIMNITSSYRGQQADVIRREFSQNNLNTIQENYTKYYSALYPNISPSEEIIFDDYRNIENKVIITEKYIIENFWLEDEEKENVILAKFYPLSLDSHLFPNENLNRKDPYFLNSDINLEHHISVILPELWRVSPENIKIENKNFEYSFQLNPGRKRFDMTHTFRNINDHVDAEDYETYIKDVKEAQKHLNFFITYDADLAGIPNTSSTSWISILLMILTVSAATYFAHKIYFNFDIASRAPTRYTEDSIKGWLGLLGISLILTPLIIIYQIFSTPEFFNPQIWNLWTGEHIGLGMLVATEIIFNSTALVFSILIIILFYKRRTIAPMVIIIYLITNFVFVTVDSGLLVFINSDVFSEVEKSEFYSQVVGSFVRMVIWVPYLILSVRVKETFVNRKYNEIEEVEPSKAEQLISLEQ